MASLNEMSDIGKLRHFQLTAARQVMRQRNKLLQLMRHNENLASVKTNYEEYRAYTRAYADAYDLFLAVLTDDNVIRREQTLYQKNASGISSFSLQTVDWMEEAEKCLQEQLSGSTQQKLPEAPPVSAAMQPPPAAKDEPIYVFNVFEEGAPMPQFPEDHMYYCQWPQPDPKNCKIVTPSKSKDISAKGRPTNDSSSTFKPSEATSSFFSSLEQENETCNSSLTTSEASVPEDFGFGTAFTSPVDPVVIVPDSPSPSPPPPARNTDTFTSAVEITQIDTNHSERANVEHRIQRISPKSINGVQVVNFQNMYMRKGPIKQTQQPEARYSTHGPNPSADMHNGGEGNVGSKFTNGRKTISKLLAGQSSIPLTKHRGGTPSKSSEVTYHIGKPSFRVVKPKDKSLKKSQEKNLKKSEPAQVKPGVVRPAYRLIKAKANLAQETIDLTQTNLWSVPTPENALPNEEPFFIQCRFCSLNFPSLDSLNNHSPRCFLRSGIKDRSMALCNIPVITPQPGHTSKIAPSRAANTPALVLPLAGGLPALNPHPANSIPRLIPNPTTKRVVPYFKKIRPTKIVRKSLLSNNVKRSIMILKKRTSEGEEKKSPSDTESATSEESESNLSQLLADPVFVNKLNSAHVVVEDIAKKLRIVHPYQRVTIKTLSVRKDLESQTAQSLAINNESKSEKHSDCTVVDKHSDCTVMDKQPNSFKMTKSFVCEICSKKFSTRFAFAAHKEWHKTGVKKRRRKKAEVNALPYSCRYCPESFLLCSQLQVHERSHTGSKPFPCSQCSESFASRMEWRAHQATHAAAE